MIRGCSDAMDLRSVDPALLELLVEVRASVVEPNGSFWLILDHDPVELCDCFERIGFTIQTFICQSNDYRVFLGRM